MDFALMRKPDLFCVRLVEYVVKGHIFLAVEPHSVILFLQNVCIEAIAGFSYEELLYICLQQITLFQLQSLLGID